MTVSMRDAFSDRRYETENFAVCREEDMQVADSPCEACVYRNRQDASCCRKYPDGKPMKLLLSEEVLCSHFSMTELFGG